MSNDELKELAAVLDGIADGKEWEAKWPIGGFYRPPVLRDPIISLRAGYEIRLKPATPQKVPLGPEDVPPLSVFRHKDGANDAWCMPSEVSYYGVTFWSYCPGGGGEHLHRTWRDMMKYVIKRPNDTDWKPCWKEIEQ
jgi:hypothetical protein